MAEKKGFKKPEPKINPADDKDFRHIVRVVNTDLVGKKKLIMALQKIKGISNMFSNFVCYSAKVDSLKIAGHLNDEEVKRLEDVIKNPAKYKCPSWMFNRRKDYETGQDMHILTTELDLAVDADMKRMKKIKSYKGFRHMWGQPVRGQRTKANFRVNKGKVSLGVKKKAPEKKS
jgi:small subunit ribosomal protein S13